MSSIGETFKRFLLSDTTGVNATVSGRIHQNTAPQVSSAPYLWFQRSGESEVTCLDGGTGLVKVEFDLECIGDTADESIDLSDTVKDRLHGASSTTGDRTIHSITVEDHSDDYIPKGTGEDAGRHVAAHQVAIWYTRPSAGWTASPDLSFGYSHSVVTVNSSESVVVLATNTDRRWAVVQNISSTAIYITVATSTGAATANSGIRINPYGDVFEMSPQIYNLNTQTIHAITSASTGNKLTVTTNAT